MLSQEGDDDGGLGRGIESLRRSSPSIKGMFKHIRDEFCSRIIVIRCCTDHKVVRVHNKVNTTVQNDRVVNVTIVSSVEVEPVRCAMQCRRQSCSAILRASTMSMRLKI